MGVFREGAAEGLFTMPEPRGRRVHDLRRLGPGPGARHARAAPAAHDGRPPARPAAPSACALSSTASRANGRRPSDRGRRKRRRRDDREAHPQTTAPPRPRALPPTPPSRREHDRSLRRRKRLTLACMCFALFMVMLDSTVVNLALKTIQLKMGASFSEVQWIVDAFVLALASLLLTGGTLGDLFGRRRAFIAGLALFTGGSVLCALAPSTSFLIGSRVVQGIGGALMLPSTLSILTNTFPDPRERARAIGMWAGISGLALAIGPADRRHSGRPLRLAEHLLDQRAHRRCRPRHGAAVRARVVGPRRPQPRPRRPGHRGHRPGSAHLRVHRGQQLRLDIGAHRLVLRRRRRSPSACSSSSSCAARRRCCSSSSSATARSAAPTWSA